MSPLMGGCEGVVCRAGIVFSILCTSACTMTTVSRNTEIANRREVVTPRADSSAIATSFRYEGDAFVGEIESGTCDRLRSFTATTTETSTTEPDRGVGALLLAVGIPIVILAEVQQSHQEPTVACSGNTCDVQEKNDAGAVVLAVVGGSLTATGVATLVWTDTTTKQRVLSRKSEEQESTGPCLSRRNMLGLKLALKLPGDGNRGVAGVVDGNQRVRIALPSDLDLPPGSELPVVVVQAPLGAKVLKRGDVVGVAVVPARD